MLLISIKMVLISRDGIGTICNAVYLFLYGIISAPDYFLVSLNSSDHKWSGDASF